MEEDSQKPSEWREMLLSAQDDTRHQTFVASDGRKIGYAAFGAESGPVVFYVHGFPGCRLSGVFFDAPAKKLGARVVAVERPGIGISSPQPGRGALDHVHDIRQLAEHLGLKSYGVMGVSGGGVYALACAYALPKEQLKGVSIVAGMGPYNLGLHGMSWSNWLTFQGLYYFPAVTRWLQSKAAAGLKSIPTEKLVEISLSRLRYAFFKRWFGPDSKDAEFLEDADFLALMIEFNKEHYRQGVEGFMGDGRVFTSDLGFRLEDVRPEIPMQLWYGSQDTNVPLRMGEAIATQLGCEPELLVKDETHLSIILKYKFEALERLLENM
ncbi:hypothetical protein Q7P37_005848 [Cladosporium fusiforme]